MKVLFHILARAIPVILIAGLGVLGYGHMQKPMDDKQAGSKKSSRSDKKSFSFSPSGNKNSKTKTSSKGLKTTYQIFTPTTYQIQLRTQGIVSAPQATQITSQVAGKVIEVSPAFANGAFVKKGDVLLEVDRASFEAAIITEDASLTRAVASLAQEKARGEQALRNWQDIGFDEKPNELVLRKPQLREAESNVKAAEASLTMARHNLEKCSVTAPFSGVIRSRVIGVGSSIGATTELGEILSTDYAEIRLPLNPQQLEELARSNKTTPAVTFWNALQTPPTQKWSGKIVRREGEMDLDSRELFLIARIEDPFSLKNTHQTPLSYNQPVLADIPSSLLENVFVIDRDHVIGLSEIITIQQNLVKRLNLKTLWEDKDHLVVSADSIPTDALLATSKLEFAAEGSKVTLIDENSEVVELEQIFGTDGNPITAEAKAEAGDSSKTL